MTAVDLYSASGQKCGVLELPSSLFDVRVNEGLMHQWLLQQQGNRRENIAHVKRRSEVRGSTRKLYSQKGTGRARRGSIRSPLLRGGGKSFGPRNTRALARRMPKSMRHTALASCLTMKAREGAVLGLEGIPAARKTKEALKFLQKLPLNRARRTLLVLVASEENFQRATRNLPKFRSVLVPYLNPADILTAHRILFVTEAIAKADKLFGRTQRTQKMQKVQKSTASASSNSSPSS